MTNQQLLIFGILGLVFAFLLWGRFRYDLVAFSALMLALVTGAVPSDQAFSGFGHPATVVIALVLIASRGLSSTGAIEALAKPMGKAERSVGGHLGIMSTVAAGLSAVMNNVAALALLMPIDIQTAKKAKRSPAATLMPLSFASILGGMVTLIGTPPNVVIASIRQAELGEPYTMFDFAPVGLVVAGIGIAFVALVGWRLVPQARRDSEATTELEELSKFTAEAAVKEKAPIIDQRLRQTDALADEHDVSVVGLIRNGRRLPSTARNQEVREGDHLVLEGSPQAIEAFAGAAGLNLMSGDHHPKLLGESLEMAEVVVPSGARIERRSAKDLRLLQHHGVTLLGVSRNGKRFRQRVRSLRIQSGDILLLVGPEENLSTIVSWIGGLPLAERGLEVLQRRKARLAVGIFAAAIAAASFGLIYFPIALGMVVAAYAFLKIIPLSQLYESIEWPVIILLASLIPIGAALESSGGTALVAEGILTVTQGLSAVWVLTILMVVTMCLSDVLNNVATALIMGPIGIEIAGRLSVNPDPFLMAVAVAASCAFLTPIGHKNNTIVMGPGGYRFGDYWRMGLPLEILVLGAGIPMILIVWPL